jgi:hypothetical protein
MCAIVFRQIKLLSCSIICLVCLLKVDVLIPVETQVDVSAPLVLKNYCFSTSKTASACFRTSRTKSGCFNTSDIKTHILVPLEPQVDISLHL